MRPLSHFGSLVAALAVGLALATAAGAAYVANAPTIPARDVIKAPVRAHTTAGTLSAPAVPDYPTRTSSAASTRARAAARSSSWWTTTTAPLTIKDSTLHNNPSRGFFTAGYPGIFYHSNGHTIVIHSTIS